MADFLIIDDEKLARVTLRKILERAGHRVAEAVNGSEGVGMFRARPFDMVITDIIMPDKEGIETIIDMKRLNPAVPVLAISGGGRTRNLDFLKLAAQYGADRIMAKPFSSEDLLQTVNDLLPRNANPIA